MEDEYEGLSEAESDEFFNRRIPVAVAYARKFMLEDRDFQSGGFLPSEKSDIYDHNLGNYVLTRGFVLPMGPGNFEFGKYSNSQRDEDEKRDIRRLSVRVTPGKEGVRKALLALTEPTEDALAKDELVASMDESGSLANRNVLKLVASLDNLRRYLINLSPRLVEHMGQDAIDSYAARGLSLRQAGIANLSGQEEINDRNGDFYYINTVTGLKILYPLLVEKIRDFRKTTRNS